MPVTVPVLRVDTTDFPIAKDNLTATAAPTSGDDINDGYVAGSRWADQTNDKIYMCRDNTAAAAVWVEITASGTGTVTSVNASGGTTGLSFSGGPVTTSGTLTLSGTLGVTNGGTGASSLTDNAVLVGNGTSAVEASTILTQEATGLAVSETNAKISMRSDLDETGSIVFYEDGVERASFVVNYNLDTMTLTNTGYPLTITGAVTASSFTGSGTGLTGINNSNWSGTDLAVVNGGTGASDAATARTNLGAGDTNGPGSSTDNGVPRFDGTGGKTLQTSRATIDDEGVIRSATNSGANAVAVPLCNWVMLTADYNLTSTTSEQKIFNTTTNGRLTLPTGVYHYECLLLVTSMSGTSGNLTFDPIGAGTATTDRWGQHCYGNDINDPTNAAATKSGVAATTAQFANNVVTSTTGTGVSITFHGMFRVSTGGTIIPSLALTTAAAASVNAGTYFKVCKVGESSETSVGNWS